MNRRIFFILFISLVAVVMVWLGGVWFNASRDIRTAYRFTFLVPAEDDIVSIHLYQRDQSATLERVDGLWYIDEYAVDRRQIDRLLTTLQELDVVGPISYNRTHHEQLQVDPKSGLHVDFELGSGELQSIIIGKQAPTPGNVYLRQLDRDETYVASLPVLSVFPLDVATWRDKVIVSVDRDLIYGIELDVPGGISRLALQNDTWWLLEDEERVALVDREVIGRFFRDLDPLRAFGFSETSVPSRPYATLRLFGLDDVTSYELVFYQHRDGQWLVQRAGFDAMYMVSAVDVEGILVDRDSLVSVE